MSILARKNLQDYTLNPRYFAVFIFFLIALLASALFINEYVPAIILGAACVVCFLIGALVQPWLIVPIIVFTTGLDSSGRLIGEAGKIRGIFHATGFHLAFVLLVIFLLTNTFLKRRIYFPKFEIKTPLILFLISIAISLSYSPNQPEATVSFLRICALVLFTYMIQVVIDSREAVAAVLWSMVLISMAGAIMGAYQVITGQFHLPVEVITALGGNVPRATGTFHNPNIFASFLMSSVLPVFAVLLNHPMGKAKRLLFLVSIAISMGGVLASFSRSSWVATIIGIMVILILSRKLRYFFILIFASILLILGLKEFVPFAEYIFERFVSIFTLFSEFGSIGRTSSTTRIFLMLASFDMFADNPLLGIGWRAFPHVFANYAPPGYPFWSHVNEPHTVLTMILGELGLVGFIAFVWFIGRVLFLSLKNLIVMQDSYLRAVFIGLIATFIAFQVNQSFNGELANNMFWFSIGLLFAVKRIEQGTRSV
jgi:putative inorganic carbon (HCO3(-)) transporter